MGDLMCCDVLQLWSLNRSARVSVDDHDDMVFDGLRIFCFEIFPSDDRLLTVAPPADPSLPGA